MTSKRLQGFQSRPHRLALLTVTLGRMARQVRRLGLALGAPAILLSTVQGLIAWSGAGAADIIHMGLPTKSFQHVIYPIAQERRYMEQEGIDLRIVLISPAPSIQALMTKDLLFTLSGTSALIARSRSGAPLKVVLAANKQVLQWVLVRPEIASPAQLKGKKIATPGIASSSTFMTKQALSRHRLEADRDVVFMDPGAGQHLKALLAGAVDAAIIGAEQRYVALNAGMRQLFFLGDEVNNSWGTLATSERIMQEESKLLSGFLKATLKALRFIRQHRSPSVQAIAKFSQIDQPLAGRVYDDLFNTFTIDGTVTEEIQRNDLAVISQLTGATEPMAISRGYDFSFARAADRDLTKSGWRP